MSPERYKAKYGAWAGRPNGSPPDFDLCCEEVTPNERGGFAHSHQCRRARGYGPDNAYCKQHDPEVAQKRYANAKARADAKWHVQRLEWAGPTFYAVLKQIADGHNDPRTLATKTIAPYALANTGEKP